jgi:GDP-4-dehydro-6-deoxy-D-mannose reductase
VRVLVTGASGFVGRHLVPAFLARGADVHKATREADVTDREAMRALVEAVQPDAIVHLAAQSSVAESEHTPERTFEVNVLGTRNVLAAAAALRPGGTVLLASTGQVYGNHERPLGFRESDPLRPQSHYAWTKACADEMGARCGEQSGLRVLRARPFNHSGTGRSPWAVESSLARQLVEIERGTRAPTLALGNPESSRDFLDVADVVDAYWRLLDAGTEPGAYNIASGEAWSVGRLAETLTELSRVGVPVTRQVDPALWRPTDYALGSAQKLRERTGWRPRVPFRETLAALLEDWRVRLGAAGPG